MEDNVKNVGKDEVFIWNALHIYYYVLYVRPHLYLSTKIRLDTNVQFLVFVVKVQQGGVQCLQGEPRSVTITPRMSHV